jgi:hypothetical protein
MNEGQPLAQTLAARMQLGLLGTANTIAHGVRVGRGIAETLKQNGVIRRVSLYGKEPVRFTAIGSIGKRAEAYGGYLYLAVAVRRDVTIQGGQVAHGIEDSVCEIDVLPYGDVRQRVGLKQYGMIYRLLNRIIGDAAKPDYLLIDRTLLLPQEFGSSDDPEVKREFQKVAQTAGDFWAQVEGQLYPKTQGGLVIAGFPQVKRIGEPLWSIANNREAALIDAITLTPIREALERARSIEEGSAARIMSTVLWPEQRSAAFAYSGLKMDERTQPALLFREIDIASFHYRSGLRAQPQQVEVAGGRAWTSDGLDRLAERLIEATPFDQPDAVPLPLWLARKQLDGIRGDLMLEQYQRDVFHTLRSGELDKAWLRGWEPDGA